jgi:hypothetical protein
VTAKYGFPIRQNSSSQETFDFQNGGAVVAKVANG